jgi:hypothetical protein
MTALYGSCGDWPWAGARCAAGSICTKHTSYYYQCLPAGGYSQGAGQGQPYSQGAGQGQPYSQGGSQPSSSAISGIAREFLLPAVHATPLSIIGGSSRP